MAFAGERFAAPSFSQAEQRLDHLRASDPHLSPMEHGDLRQSPGSSRCQTDENMAAIGNPLVSANKPKARQFVDQTNGGVMFDLQPFAELADGEAGGTGERLHCQKRFVLLGCQIRLGRQSAFAETKEFSQGVPERSEGVVILGMQLGGHAGETAGT